MKQKKLLLLGGLQYLLPVIEEAHKLGAYVITADYLPSNIAHKYSDEYVNVSIIDKEAVLKVAQEEHDAFANALRSEGVEVVYVTDLVAEALDAGGRTVRRKFIEQNASLVTDLDV